MCSRSIVWDSLLKTVNRYYSDAEKCLECGAYLAGLAVVRATLEAMLYSRFLLEFFDREIYPPEKLKELNVKVDINKGEIVVPHEVNLKVLIEEAFKLGLLNKTGYKSAERIRKWGNKIHPSRIATGSRLLRINSRILKARLKDLDIVREQLLSKI